MQIKVGDYLGTKGLRRWFRVTGLKDEHGGDVQEVGGMFASSKGSFEVYADGLIVASIFAGGTLTRIVEHYTPFEYELLKCTAGIT